MLRTVNSFRGEVPLVTPRALPDNASQEAINARLYTGDLTAFRQFTTTHGLANTGPVKTLSLMAGQYWLSWDEQVDVARGVVPGDTTYRTYLTGLDKPRFTNLDLATGVPNGSAPEPYPWMTRLLGVPPPDAPPTTVTGVDPTPATFSVDVFDEGDDLATNWTTSGVHSATNFASRVLQSATVGNPLPSYKIEIENTSGTPAYAYRNFGIAGSTVSTMSVDFMIDPGQGGGGILVEIGIALGATGSGARVAVVNDIGSPALCVLTGSDWASQSILAQVGLSHGLTRGVWYTLTAQRVVNADNSVTVTAGVYAGSGQMATVIATSVFFDGDNCAIMGVTGDDEKDTYYDNIHVQASGSLNTTITNIATNYVYTFVNDLGEESAPSLPSATILRPDGVSVTITTPTGTPTGVDGDYFITTKRIYRAATGSTGTAYRFVAEIPISQADYVDVLTDAELGEVLQSDVWTLPPDDLRGILALPNGVMVGFRRNQLCFSAQNQPHAWPVEYRLNTDTDIVGIGNIDTTVVIGTESFLYVASGNDPAAYSMSKFEVPHAASSKLSFAYITGLGVVFSGPDGLMVCAGIGQVKNLTQTVFTRRQWQALDPTSIASVAHNDIYFMFWQSGSAQGCYAVDLRPDGFGIVQMAFHASAAYVDPIEDKMYLVLDTDDEPDDPLLPIPASIPTYVDARTVFEFEGSPTELMNYRWRTKLWLEQHPSFYSIAQVRRGPDAVGNLLARFFGDGVQLDEILIEGDVEFTLTPPDAAYNTFEMELTGTDTVRVIQAADDVTELG
jgi:hypothetical protein